ncbi:hypothetical protein HanPI659440_Chr11g0423701 [Helianthus annuus]|nr:hypothetical protein HanPI659440_Chr11g0423701 [Helianthus annuus]
MASGHRHGATHHRQPPLHNYHWPDPPPLVLSLCFIILSRPILSLHFLTAFNCLKILTLTVIGNGSSETVSDHITSNSTTDLQLQSTSLIGIRADDYALNWLWRNCSFETLTKLVFENCNGIGGNQPFSRFITRLTNLHELELFKLIIIFVNL